MIIIIAVTGLAVYRKQQNELGRRGRSCLYKAHGPAYVGGQFLDYAPYPGDWVDFTSTDGSAGGGHRTNNWSGDLEYVVFLTCQTVRIVSETSWDWLEM